MLKIAVVEDETEQVDELKGFISEYAYRNAEECICITFDNGVDFLSEYGCDCDVVFLDIDMPLMDGMDVAGKLREIDKAVNIVIITNYPKYAVDGYKVEALDFLVKPVSSLEINSELQKISSAKVIRMNEFIWVTVDGIIRRIHYMDIYYVEVIGHDVCIHTKNGNVSFRGTLKSIEDQLNPKIFSRCHVSYIVNMHFVTSVDLNNMLITLEGTDDKIQVSRSKKKEFTDSLMEYVATNGGVSVKTYK